MTDDLLDAGQAAELLARRWALHVLIVLSRRSLRRNDLRRAVADLQRAGPERRRGYGETRVHDKVLSGLLSVLEADGLVERRVLDVHPPGVQYALTEDGRNLLSATGPIAAWQHDRRQAPAHRHRAPDCLTLRCVGVPDDRPDPT